MTEEQPLTMDWFIEKRVEEIVEEVRVNSLVEMVTNVSANLNLTIAQALTALGISDADKAIIIKRLQ